MTVMINPSNFRLASNEDGTTTITFNSQMVPILEDLIKRGLDDLNNDLDLAETHAREDGNPEAIDSIGPLTHDILMARLWLLRFEKHSSRKD